MTYNFFFSSKQSQKEYETFLDHFGETLKTHPIRAKATEIPLLIELSSESKPYLDRDLQIALYSKNHSKSKHSPSASQRTSNSSTYYTGYDYDFASSHASFRAKLFATYGVTGFDMFGSRVDSLRYANQGAEWVWNTMIFNEDGDWAHEFLST